MKLFPPFRLDTVNYRLWRGDELVQIAPKAFDALRYLVEHAGQLVTQDEMLEALWPETYVNPDVVKKYVLEIRKVLGDRPDEPKFIETTRKRGYRFVATVDDDSLPATSDSSTDNARRMVGRERALAKLQEHLDRALRGQRQVVFVTGEAGVGKTTLVDVFHRQAAGDRPGLRIARGQCVEGFGGKEAYYPLLEAIGKLVRDTNDRSVFGIVAKLAPTWLIQFPSVVKPEQREALQREIFGSTRERMVREICEAIEAMTETNPLLLILEDLHWVDPSTLDVLSALARRRDPARLVVVGTYRPLDPALSGSPLKNLKPDLLAHQLCVEVALEHLEESEIEEYLATVFAGEGSPQGLANLIFRHSGGNALFMVEIVRHMLKTGTIARREAGRLLTSPLADVDPGVPDTLQQILEIQLDKLNEPERLILKSASVAGERFSVWGIGPTLDMEEDDIERLCEGLSGREMFIRSVGLHELDNGAASAQYDFRHSLYRQVLYRGLSEATRSKLHLCLGERLAACTTKGRQDLSSELALHFEEGRDYEQAIYYWISTAQNAAGRFAHRECIQILNHARELAPRVNGSAGVRLEIQILDYLGDVHYALGNMADSAAAHQMAAARAAEVGWRAAQVNALNRLALSLSFDDPERGLEICAQSERVASSHNDPLLLARTQMLASSCRLLYGAWRKEDAEVCAASDRIVRSLMDSAAPEHHMLYAYVQSIQGAYRESLLYAEAGVEEIAGTSSLIVYLSIASKAITLLQIGRWGEALRLVREAREMVEKNGNDPWIFTFREAWLHTFVLDFGGAIRLCEAIMSTGLGRRSVQPKTIARLAAGHAATDLKKYDEAIHCFEEICDPDLTPRFFLRWYWRIHAQLGLCRAWLESGNIGNASGAIDSLLESTASTPEPNLQALAWTMHAQVALAGERLDCAADSIRKALVVVENFEIPVTAWQAHATAWQFYRAAQDEKTANHHRARAEAVILALANSFDPGEPLRQTFLMSPTVRRVLIQ